MELKINIRLNENLYLRDPEASELGRKIVKKSIEMIYTLGLESFTFKKLADQINTTEASIYRYFESKQRLLQYIVAWYWNFLEYQVIFHINNLKNPEDKIKKVIKLLLANPDNIIGAGDIDTEALHAIVIQESSKAYLNKDVDEANSVKLFQPYKDLCTRIAGIISEYNPDYEFPRSLSSTLIETTHFQEFFMQHLPRLTDFGLTKDKEALHRFLNDLVFSVLKK
jgi:AcrR family transcriptional regulator